MSSGAQAGFRWQISRQDFGLITRKETATERVLLVGNYTNAANRNYFVARQSSDHLRPK